MEFVGKSERTKTDKKRERRKKKLKQKFHINYIITKNLVNQSKSNKPVHRGEKMQKVRNVSIIFIVFHVENEII